MKTRLHFLLLPVVLLSVLAFAGCSPPDLIILDTTGAPIEGAKIVGASLSIGGQTSYSDKNGHAKIPSAIQQTKWISVYKSGYLPIENIDASQTRPILVKMKKQNGQPDGAANGSQPFRSETNRTSAAAGSRR